MPATSSAFGFAALSSPLVFNTEYNTEQNADAAFVISEDGYIQALPDAQFVVVDGRPEDVEGGQWQWRL